MKLMQVFDCQEMPDDIRNDFYVYVEADNGCYVSFYMDNYEVKDEKDYKELVEDEGRYFIYWYKIYTWLKEQGATDSEVLVKHWW